MPHFHDREMKTIMNLDNLHSIEQLESFLKGSQPITLTILSNKDERYAFAEKLLRRFGYQNLKRPQRGILCKFLVKVTGYSRQQVTRLIKQYQATGRVVRHQKTLSGFFQFYTKTDIQLLAAMDQRHNTPNGMMVKKLCERAYHRFNELEYERLSTISVAHIYNLRKTFTYKNVRHHYEKTKSAKVSIGERRKPYPEGKPGFIRIDTVHQGDLDGEKGVYHINAIDEITQFEIVVSVEKISEAYLLPALKYLLQEFPFVIINFHSDNGSEYVNHAVANLLNKLLIEFTKSRPRHCNDNPLAESKNASVVRKTFGYEHIPQRFATKINEFNRKALNPYLNYHRPCLFPTEYIDDKGKARKKYRYEDMMTPYDKLKSLPNAKQYLKPNVNFAQLDDIAEQMTDNEAADLLNQLRQQLFKHIHGNGNLNK